MDAFWGFSAVAAAFGDKAELNAELEEKIRFFFKIPEDNNDSPALKLATVSRVIVT